MLKMVGWICAALVFSASAWAQEPLVVQVARKHVTLNGYTRSRTTQTIASEVAGKVLHVHYDLGQTIGAQPFLEIDATFIDFQIEQVQWSLQKIDISKSRSLSRVSYLKNEFERIDKLHKGDVATQARWDAAAEELNQAKMELHSTRVERSTLATQLRELKERRKRHTVHAPKGWVVVDRRVEPGEIIATGTPLARVADYTQLVVPLFVSSKELSAIQQTPTLAIELDGGPARARLSWINPEFNERTRKLAIELEIINYDGTRRGGLSVALPIDVATQGLMVPQGAISNRYDNPRVVLDADGQSVAIVILGENNGHILIAHHPKLAPGTQLRSPSESR